MFHIDRKAAMLGLAMSATAALAAILVGSAGAQGSPPAQHPSTSVREVASTVPSVNLTSNDPGAIHGKVSAPTNDAGPPVPDAATLTPDAAPRAADDPTTPPATTAPTTPTATEAPILIPITPTTDTPPPPPRSPENTPIVTPTLPPRN